MKTTSKTQARLELLRFLKKCFCIAFVLASLIHLTGCATGRNGFSQFYQDRAGTAITNMPPYSGTTRIIAASADPKNDVKDLYRNGFVMIGESAFQGPPQGNNALMSQAKKVGADVVLVSSVYLGSQQTAVPFMQYNPGQTYTTTSSGTVNANAYGSSGYAYGTGNYYGSSSTTSPGTFTTQMIPVTVQRYNYDAGFFRKMPQTILGVIPQPLPQEIRQHLERNTGVFVWVVRNDSPAFNANILEGDVILQMNGEDVKSVADYIQKYTRMAGQQTDVEIWRNGQLKTVSVQLNNKP
jgi:membrane-associated protease RseP (regulator of RpoE activity)